MADQEEANILAMLSSPEQYKKNSKNYKKIIASGDLRMMLIITETIQKCLEQQSSENAMTMLNGVRFVKETIEATNGTSSTYNQLIGERIMPLLSQCALFAKEKKDDDRGKQYFSDNPSKELAVIGNSFFRLVIECILVWGGWFQNSIFSEILAHLRSQGVSFPQQLNYFKDIQPKVNQDNPQNNISSSRIEDTSIMSKYQNVQPNNSQIGLQNAQLSNSRFSSTKNNQDEINLDNIQTSDQFNALLNSIIPGFQQEKKNLENTLISDAVNYDLLNKSIIIILSYSNKFKVLIEKCLTFESSNLLEHQLSILFNESEFADIFLADIAAFKQKSISFQEIRKKYGLNFQPQPTPIPQQGQKNQPLSQKEIEGPINQKTSDDEEVPYFSDEEEKEQRNRKNQKIVSKPEMKPTNISSTIQNSSLKNLPVQTNQSGVKRQFIQNGSSAEIADRSSPVSSQTNIRAQGQQNLPQVTKIQRSSLQDRPQENNVRASNRSPEPQLDNQEKNLPFRSLLQSSEIGRYKVEIKSGSSFKKDSSPTNPSSYYSGSIKSVIIKKNNLDQEEVIKLKKQLESLTDERNSWMLKFERALSELNELKEQGNNQLK